MINGMEVEPIQYLASFYGTPGQWVQVKPIRLHYLSFPAGGDFDAPLPDSITVLSSKLWLEDWTEEEAMDERLEIWWME
jgi:hypothetical protein